jgi:iron complex outermembrane receptor protein
MQFLPIVPLVFILPIGVGNAADRTNGVAAPADSLQEIVVTAERRPETLQKTSLAIEVMSADQLRNAGVEQARDLTKLDPSIQIGQGGPATQIYIRGVGDFGTTAISSPSVATNMDGVYISRETGIEGNFFDLARVEVLKGPQGTLYGRNSSGGVINIISNAPALGVTSGQIEVEAGDYSEGRTAGFVNLPIGSTIAFRAAFEFMNRAGYDSQGYDDDRHQSGRLSLRWEPNDSFRLRVTGDVQHIGGIGPGYVFKGPEPDASLGTAVSAYAGAAIPTDPRVVLADPRVTTYYNALYQVLGLPCLPIGVPLAATAAGPVPLTTGNTQFCPAGTFNLLSNKYNSTFYEDNLLTNVSAQADWDLPFATLSIIPAYRGVDDNYVVLPLVPVKNLDTSYAKSLETRLGHSGDRLIWTAGVYLYQENQRIRSGYAGVSRWDLLGAGRNNDQIETESQAVFGQTNFHVTPQWRLIGGLRHTRDHKYINGAYEVTTQIIGLDFLAPGVAGPAPGPCFGKGSPTSLCIEDAYANSRTWAYTSYKAGTEFDLTDLSMLYLTYAVGQKSGGYNDESGPVQGVAATFNPETVKALEAGSKNRFFGEKLQVNAEAFYWRYDNAQQYISVANANNVPENVLENVGTAKSYGLDVDIAWKPTTADSLHVSAEYLHTRFDRFTYAANNVPTFATSCAVTPVTTGLTNESINCAGKPLTRAPKYSGTASYSHTFALSSGADITAILTAQAATTRELTTDYTKQSQGVGFAEGDFNLVYRSASRKWSVAGFVHNFNNALDYTGGFDAPANLPGAFVATLAAPRTYGARASVDF